MWKKSKGKFFLFALFQLSTIIGAAQVHIIFINKPKPGTTTEDTVYYSPDRKLKWEDFTGKIRQPGNYGAVSFTAFSYDAASREQKDSVWVTLYLQTYFVKPASWVKTDSKNPYALSHEQLHFDITKLMAQEFKDSVLNASFSTDHYDIEIHFIYWDFWRKMNRVQEEFDRQTAHGKNKAEEERWESKIHKALNEKRPK